MAFANPPGIDVAANGYFNGTDRIGKFSWFGNKVMGNGFPNLALGAGFWAYGAWKNKPYTKYAGIAQVESVVATGLTVAILKSLSNRTRPDGSDDLSFPSAHTAYAFTTAAVLGSFYGPKVGVPMYALATLTAIGRMQDNRHWLTDTLVGAAVGVGFGLMFANMNKKNFDRVEEIRANESKIQANPMISPNSIGASVSLSF